MVIVRARTVQVQPENSVIRLQREPEPHICRHMQIRANSLLHMCDVVRMVREQHDAPCFDQGVEWSRYGQYQFEMVIVRAHALFSST